MSFEKRGNFELEKSFTDDGSGKRAKIAPKGPDHLIFTTGEDKNELNKQASTKQQSTSVSELLDGKRGEGNSK